MTKINVNVAGVCLLILGSAALASAQQFETPRLTLGAAAGLADPLHADVGYTGKSWEADIRGQVARHLSIEVFLSQWRHASEAIYPATTVEGPAGVLARNIQTTIDDRTRVGVLGFSFLSAFTAGRVTIAGGGGPALMAFRRDYVQRVTGCAPPICGTYDTRYKSETFAVSVVGGVDVRLVPWLSAFGQTRAAIPAKDPGSGQVAVTAGVRFVLR